MLKSKKTQIIEEVPYGLYLWKMHETGGLVCDENGNYLNVAATKGDVRKINLLKEAAASLGLADGEPVWFGGHRQVTDEEYEEQKQRLEWGLIPDEYDLPAIKEDLEERKKKGLI